jgi:amino acid transporter
VALIFVLYAFGGWNDSAFVAAEVRNPKRNVPRALFTGVAIGVVGYIAVNAAYINGLGWQDVTQFGPKDVPTRLIERTPLGAQGGQAMCALIMISALGACNGLIFTGPRVYAAVGAEHGIFGWMGRWRPGRGTPITALLVQAVLTVFIVAALTTKEGHEAINSCLAKTNELLRDLEQDTLHYQNEWKPNEGFDTLVARTAPVFWAFFMLTGLSLFVLREKYKDVPRPYSVPWYPLVPFLFVNACAWMLYRSIIYVEWHALFAVVIVLLGIPLYGLSRLISGPPDMTLGDEYTPQPPSPGSIQQAETKLRRSWR